jgi:hypothetical protein
MEEGLLAYDRSGGAYNGRLYLGYTDVPTGGSTNNTDVYLMYSNNNGTSWSSRKHVNDDGTYFDHFLPDLAVDQTSGNVALCWYDCRHDSGDTYTQCFAAISRTGGDVFSPNFQICPGPSNANTGGNPLGYGDYTGLAYYKGFLRFVWADNSNSTGDNSSGTMDIYSCTLAY